MNYLSLWLLLLGFLLGVATTTRRCDTSSFGGESLPTTTTHVEIIYDTIRISDPKPIAIEAITIEAIAIKATTVEPITIESIKVVQDDANQNEHEPLNLYTFADTLSGAWSATVVGRDVELRELTLHNRIEYRTQNIYRPPVWEVMVQTHLWSTMPCIGLNIVHNIERIHLSGFVGYSPYVGGDGGGSIIVGGSLGVTIWRRY